MANYTLAWQNMARNQTPPQSFGKFDYRDFNQIKFAQLDLLPNFIFGLFGLGLFRLGFQSSNFMPTHSVKLINIFVQTFH
jgi:hypothetical protein